MGLVTPPNETLPGSPILGARQRCNTLTISHEPLVKVNAWAQAGIFCLLFLGVVKARPASLHPVAPNRPRGGPKWLISHRY